MKISNIFLSMIAFLLNLIQINNQVCVQYNCTTTEQKCFKEINPLLIDIQECQDGKKCQTDNGSCKSRSYDNYEQFNGGPCNNNDDCLYGDCDNANICIKTKSTCKKHTDCEIGYFCNSSSNCEKVKKLNEDCSSNEDCQYNLACDMLGSKKCINYFSLKEYSKVNDYNQYLCESGFEVNGICLNAKLKSNEDCSDTSFCSYEDSKGDLYNSTEKCNCKINPYGGKLCDYGADDPKAINLINEYKNLINQDSNSCHTTERLQLCVAFAFDRKVDGKFNTTNRFEYDKAKRLLNNKLTLNSNQFINNKEDFCGYSVIGSYNNYLVPPQVVSACPIYKCEDSTKNCLESFNPNNNNSTGITISINQDICKSNEFCSYDISKSYVLEKYNGFCKTKTPSSQKQLRRYPGEECIDDTDCLNGLCLNNICYFKRLGEICDQENPFGIHGCGLGLYCADKKNSEEFNKCESLKEYGEECKNSYECEMDTICYDGVCSKQYFGYENGKVIHKEFIKDDYIKSNIRLMCQSVYFSNKEEKCAEFKIMNNTNQDNFAECSIANKNNACVYQIITDYKKNNLEEIETFTQKCECGFNGEGKAYCPIDNYNCKIFFFKIF